MSCKTNVTAICLNEIPSALVGVNTPLSFLDSKGKINFKFIKTIEVQKEDIVNSDVIITIRGSEEYEREIIEECKRLNKYIIYFLDDDLLNVPKSANCSAYFENHKIRENIIEIMKSCDCLWTTNINIARKYERNFNKTVVINAPALLIENEKKELSNVILKNKKIKIGFAGGLDHKNFLEDFMQEPVKLILDKYKDSIEIEFFGVKPSFIEEYSLTHIPYQANHEDYKNVIKSRNWDIAIAPLQKSEFHKCKYFNKFLEYSAIGAVGIYSHTEPYTLIVRNGVNGVLVENNSADWVNAISYVIENEEERLKMRKNALEETIEKFSVEAISKEAVKNIQELETYRSPTISRRDVKLKENKDKYYVYKIKNIIKTRGIGAPIYIIKKIMEKIKNRL